MYLTCCFQPYQLDLDMKTWTSCHVWPELTESVDDGNLNILPYLSRTHCKSWWSEWWRPLPSLCAAWSPTMWRLPASLTRSTLTDRYAGHSLAMIGPVYNTYTLALVIQYLFDMCNNYVKSALMKGGIKHVFHLFLRFLKLITFWVVKHKHCDQKDSWI